MADEVEPTTPSSSDSEDLESGGDDVDYSPYFVHTDPFGTVEEAVEWCREVAIQHRFFLIKASQKKQHDGRYDHVLNCDRYKKPGLRDFVSAFRRNTSSKGCGCKFRLKVVQDRFSRLWSVVADTKFGTHNHKLFLYREGHRQLNSLSPDAKKVIAEMTRSHAAPNAIEVALKKQFPGISPNRRQIYNYRETLRRERCEGRNPAEQFIHSASRYGYLFWTQTEQNVITHTFVVHKTSAALVRTYPWVILIDSTYKTNRYKFPLLEIIGVTPTNKNFLIGWSLMKDEKTESYQWVLERLRDLLGDRISPNAIITDRELGLFIPLSTIFPNSRHLLCRWHITNDVERYVRNKTRDKETASGFSQGTFKKLMNSIDETTYEAYLQSVRVRWSWVSGLIDYLEGTWLVHREKFVHAWTNKVRHYGNTSNCRIESQHAALKNWLASSTASMDTLFESVHAFIETQHKDIRYSLEKSTRVSGTEFESFLFDRIKCNTSHHCLNIIKEELLKLGMADYVVSQCTHVIRMTHGIPCMCILLKRMEKDKPLKIKDVDQFWRTLEINEDNNTQQSHDGVDATEDGEETAHLARLVTQVENSDPAVRRRIIRMLHEELHPTASSFTEPIVNTNIRGRPRNSSTRREPSSWEYSLRGRRSSARGRGRGRTAVPTELTGWNTDIGSFPFRNNLPAFLLSYLQGWIDVQGDGNCGFRCVAEAFHGGEDNWALARNSIAAEVESHWGVYERCGTSSKEQWLSRLRWLSGPCDYRHWMEVYADLFPIANLYRSTVIFIGLQRETQHVNFSITVLPWRNSGNLNRPRQEFVIAHLGSYQHYILLKLARNSPIPPVCPMWYNIKEGSVSRWDELYNSRCTRWRSLSGFAQTTETVIID